MEVDKEPIKEFGKISITEAASVLQSKINELIEVSRKFQAENQINSQINESEGDIFSSGRKKLTLLEDIEDQYKEIADTHKRLGLRFSFLQSSLHAAQKSSVMNKILNLDHKMSNDNEHPFEEELDEEELKFVKQLLDEQNSLTAEVLAKQSEIVQSEIELVRAKNKLVPSLFNLKEMYTQIEDTEDEPEVIEKKLQDKKMVVVKEEQKVTEMKQLIISIVNAFPSTLTASNGHLLEYCGKSIESMIEDLPVQNQ